MHAVPRPTHEINKVLKSNTLAVFPGLDKLTLKFTWKPKGPRIASLETKPKTYQMTYFTFSNLKVLIKTSANSQAVVALAFNPSTQEAEAGGSL